VLLSARLRGRDMGRVRRRIELALSNAVLGGMGGGMLPCDADLARCDEGANGEAVDLTKAGDCLERPVRVGNGTRLVGSGAGVVLVLDGPVVAAAMGIGFGVVEDDEVVGVRTHLFGSILVNSVVDSSGCCCSFCFPFGDETKDFDSWFRCCSRARRALAADESDDAGPSLLVDLLPPGVEGNESTSITRFRFGLGEMLSHWDFSIASRMLATLG